MDVSHSNLLAIKDMLDAGRLDLVKEAIDKLIADEQARQAAELTGELERARYKMLGRMVAMMVATEPQRRAFVAGYNGDGLPRHFSRQMHVAHDLGREVKQELHP